MSATRAVTAAPCAKCPFRKDVPVYLRRGRRVEIAAALAGGAPFPCHAEVRYDEDDGEPHGGAAPMCAGAAKALLANGATNNYMRVMERLGAMDLDATADRGPAVWDLVTWQQLPEGATADQPGEPDDDEPLPCGTVNAGCLAPAGYLRGGVVVVGEEAADGECARCGDPLCSACASPEGLCAVCAD